MTRVDSFARGVLFAAMAAAAWLPWSLLAVPLCGVGCARAAYLVAVATVYAAGVAARRRRLAAATVAAAGTLATVAAGSTAALAIVLAAMIGAVRTRYARDASRWPVFGREIALIGGGLLAARVLAATPALPTGFALWGFFLVQSLFHLRSARAEPPASGDADRFDLAYRRASDLLVRCRTGESSGVYGGR